MLEKQLELLRKLLAMGPSTAFLCAVRTLPSGDTALELYIVVMKEEFSTLARVALSRDATGFGLRRVQAVATGPRGSMQRRGLLS